MCTEYLELFRTKKAGFVKPAFFVYLWSLSQVGELVHRQHHPMIICHFTHIKIA